MPELSKTYTLKQFVDSGKKVSITYDKFSTTETVDNIRFPVFHVIDDYLDELKSMCVDVELSEREYLKYRYRPKILAYDIYNSIDLDFIILAVNGLADMKEFDLRTLKLLKKQDLTDALSSIYGVESDFIKSNRN